MSFENKVVIVTGASSGIGAAIAVGFAEEGAKVVLVGRNKEKLKNVSNKCGITGSKLVIIADVTKEGDLKRIVNNTITNFGQIDVLINNVGRGSDATFSDDWAVEEFDKVMNTNLRSVVHLTNLASKYLIESKGNIVNISSILSVALVDVGFAYCAAKAGLDHFTRSIAAELAPMGVRVNSINPGPVKTDLFENLGHNFDESEALWKHWLNKTAMKRMSEPKEIADLALFLASDKAVAITGSSIFTDNGFALNI